MLLSRIWEKLQSLSFRDLHFCSASLPPRKGNLRESLSTSRVWGRKLFAYSQTLMVIGSRTSCFILQNYPRNAACDGLFSVSLCWILREPSDMVSKPNIFCSETTGENVINFCCLVSRNKLAWCYFVFDFCRTSHSILNCLVFEER